MQDSSWPGENAGFLPVPEQWDPGRGSTQARLAPFRIINFLAPAELRCLSPVELLSYSRKPYQGVGSKGVEEDQGLLCHAGFCTLVEFISGGW